MLKLQLKKPNPKVLLRVRGSDYFGVPDQASGDGTFPADLDGADFVVLAKTVGKFKVALAVPDDPLEFDVFFMGLSEEEAKSPASPRLPITGAATLSAVATKYAGRNKVKEICVLIEPKKAPSTSASAPAPGSAVVATGGASASSGGAAGGGAAGMVMGVFGRGTGAASSSSRRGSEDVDAFLETLHKATFMLWNETGHPCGCGAFVSESGVAITVAHGREQWQGKRKTVKASRLDTADDGTITEVKFVFSVVSSDKALDFTVMQLKSIQPAGASHGFLPTPTASARIRKGYAFLLTWAIADAKKLPYKGFDRDLRCWVSGNTVEHIHYDAATSRGDSGAALVVAATGAFIGMHVEGQNDVSDSEVDAFFGKSKKSGDSIASMLSPTTRSTALRLDLPAVRGAIAAAKALVASSSSSSSSSGGGEEEMPLPRKQRGRPASSSSSSSSSGGGEEEMPRPRKQRGRPVSKKQKLEEVDITDKAERGK